MFSKMQFHGRWRDYQQRVLEELRGHLEDTKLHIVAAPGSGKTVLGLEVMRELARPTIILSPTLTIRNQWSERLFEMFLSRASCETQDISDDLRRPGMMTSVTYQALHALWKVDEKPGEECSRLEFDRLIAHFNSEAGVTIIVDEAHHLRREWWRALNALLDSLPHATLVALTATPPYDASYAEWSRYDNLCGPVDAEISVPELVRNGDLCPHQDFIHFSVPQHSEMELLIERRRGIATLVSDLTTDQDFIGRLASHPWVTAPDVHEQDILDNPEYLSSILILMTAGNGDLPDAPLDLLGVEDENIPILSSPWLEVFLNGYLFSDTEDNPEIQRHRKQIEKQLRQMGFIENSRVKLTENRQVIRTIAGSLAKLESIVEIAKTEHHHLDDDLRMVVLTDYVRASDLPRKADQPFAPKKLGVVPIFEILRRANIDENRIGILTGTLAIIPETAHSALSDAAIAGHIPEDDIILSQLSGCSGYLQLRLEGKSSRKMVHLVTSLFNRGAIRILVGTQALLGEGWDAPTINTLVLASNVGSYMLSNQMRGRAIRIDKDTPDKVANIWHLATVEPRSERFWPTVARFEWDSEADQFAQYIPELGSDMRLLRQRFEMFEGISNDTSQTITNGIGRLDLATGNWDVGDIDLKNRRMTALAEQRSRTSEKWALSLGDSHQRSHVHKIAEANYAPRQISYQQTLHYLAISAVLGGLTSAAGTLRQFQSIREIATLIMIFGGLTLVYSVPKLALATRLFVRNGTLERSLRQVAQVVLESLGQIGMLDKEPEAYKTEVEPSVRGHHNIILHHASRSEEKIFLDALAEILGPIQNPRYLLIRKSWLGILMRQDYHAVPTILGTHRDHALYFTERWNKHIGPIKPIFTRRKDGRRLLLKARSRSMAAGFQRFVDRRSQWR